MAVLGLILVIAYFIIFLPIKSHLEDKENERKAKAEKDRLDRIRVTNKLERDYRRGYYSLKASHPNWTWEDFYDHSDEVIAEERRLEEKDRIEEQQRLAKIRAEKELKERQKNEWMQKEILNHPLRSKYACAYYKRINANASGIDESQSYKVAEYFYDNSWWMDSFDKWISEQERIVNSPDPEAEKKKIEEEHKKQAEEAQERRRQRLEELKRKQAEEKRELEYQFGRLKSVYPRGVMYARNVKNWSMEECLKNQSQIREFEREEKEKERRRELEEAERRRKQQEKESALRYMNNAVINWEKARGEVPVYSLFYYYPTTCTDVFIDSKKQQVRKLIWNFKDGMNFYVGGYVEKVLNHFFGKERLKYITFVCIPASNTFSNERRYKNFSEGVCKAMGMEDAFSHITLSENKTAAHLGGNNSSDNVQVDRSFFFGKSVILFDDITTRGDSMVNMKRKLENAGAKVICGITLGKTVHVDRGTDPYELI